MAKHEPAAAIDIGTNTVLLLIARTSATGELEVLEDHCRTVRLGQGLAATGVLAPEAVARTLQALSEFAARIRAAGIAPARVRVVSTAVLRRAQDAQAFVAAAEHASGLRIEVISGEEEARLGQVAVQGEGASPSSVVIDVGGGSTEVACAALHVRISAPLGAVVATETFLGPTALVPGGFQALRAAARQASLVFPEGLARQGGERRDVIALGGTALNLVSLAQAFERFEPERAEGQLVRAAAAGEFAERLAPMSFAERCRLPIESERAEILPAGLACLAAACERIGAQDLRVTGRGLRFGVVRNLLNI